MNQSRSNESSIRDNLVASVVDIDQSSANLEVSPEKTSSNEHNDLVVVSATGTDGLETHHEQPLTADSASQDAETELVLPLDSSDSDYESSDLGDFSKAFEAVQWLRMEGIAQDPNQNIQDTATPFSIVKQTAFDQGMRAFWTIFDQAWSIEFTGCVTRHEESPETADLPTTRACNNSAAALTTVTALGKRSRNEDDSEAPDDDDRNNGHKRNKSTPYSKSSMIASGFACPYRKHDALQYSVGKWKICALTPQSTVARVKEHLYRYHRVHQCQRCKDCFKEEKELDVHFEANEGCESRPMKIVEGITAKMEKQLRCRKKAYRGQSESERWKEIYKLLFPQEAVPDPYFEPVRELKTEQSSLSSDSQDIADYEGYLRRELPRCFRRALEAAISDDNDPIEDHLTGRIMDMYQDCQDLVLSSYRTSLEAASTAIPTFVPEPTIELVAQVAEYNVATWNTGSSIDVDEGSSNTCPNYPQRYDGITTPSRGSETMQSNKAMNGDTGNDFHFDFTPNGPGMPPQELSSSTIIADWQTSSEIAAYPLQMNTVPLRHVDISNSFEWDDLLQLDP
ncbi:hypothetical protein DL95DRAFT_501668 [Leptodontidium sp. 2 PMI_412]|nr:hypothetical protein DL95DRAFT_501668 [Leptodontidium sp. 2 PMI_412]